VEWLKDFPWRDVAATAIVAFLFWRVFLKLTEIIVTRLDKIVDNTREIDRTLKLIAQNDLKHLSQGLDCIVKLLGQLKGGHESQQQ